MFNAENPLKTRISTTSHLNNWNILFRIQNSENFASLLNQKFSFNIFKNFSLMPHTKFQTKKKLLKISLFQAGHSKKRTIDLQQTNQIIINLCKFDYQTKKLEN